MVPLQAGHSFHAGAGVPARRVATLSARRLRLSSCPSGGNLRALGKFLTSFGRKSRFLDCAESPVNGRFCFARNDNALKFFRLSLGPEHSPATTVDGSAG